MARAMKNGMEQIQALLGQLKGTRQLTIDRVTRGLGEPGKWRDSGDDIGADLDPFDQMLSTRRWFMA